MPRLQPEFPPGVRDVMIDRFGRRVVLTEERWQHIVHGHPAMEGLDLALKRAVEQADVRRAGNRPGVELLFGANLGPAKWLVAVIAYDESSQGMILTAYPQTKDPKPEESG